MIAASSATDGMASCYTRPIMAVSPTPKSLPVTLVPGVTYAPLTRRARVEGIGLEVWEIVRVYRMVGEDLARLQRSFDWLTPEHLRVALTFAAQNPAFIAAEIAEADAAPRRLEELWRAYPFTVPSHLR